MYKNLMVVAVMGLTLSACAPWLVREGNVKTADVKPEVRPEGLAKRAAAPRRGANTVESFDTTTEAQRREAMGAPRDANALRLGKTIVSLGDPADPGFWLATPLVSAVTQGRLENPKNGRSVAVELRPIAGAVSAGSRLSLPGMRALAIALNELGEVVVYSGT